MRLAQVTHSWNLTPKSAMALQRRLAIRVATRALKTRPRLIAGLDAAFSPDGKWCLAGVILWDIESKKPVETRTARSRLRFPYIPGLLSFREAPALLMALRRLETQPDLLLCDGQGLAHPRRFGIACHLGVLVGLPAVGCAKSRLVGEFQEPRRNRGAWTPLHHQTERVGDVLRTRDRVKPVFVSPGHAVDFRGSREIVLAASGRYRLPEPTRLADRLVAEWRRQLR